MAKIELNVLTLNCWGVFTPGACKDKTARISAIGTAVSSSSYDLVIFQEIWEQADYQKLVAKLHNTFPNTHYFHSGMFGSGVCIFSKHPILETWQHRFVLNGYPHRVYHGDWFGGKSVGLTKLEVKGFRVNVYSTHLHAEYDDVNDEYLAHRVAQSYEVGEYIKMSGVNCDVIILAGDFNLQPKDLGYKLITTNANLLDSWLTQKATPNDEHGGTTCERPDNIYHSPPWLARYPHGLRLDYLMYRANTGIEMVCERCELTLRKVPSKPYPYSDHEGLCAKYTIRHNERASPPSCDSASVEEHFMAALPILDKGMRKARASRIFFSISILICLVLLIYFHSIEVPVISSLLRFILTICMAYFGWAAFIAVTFEIKSIMAIKCDINNILRSNPNPI